MSMLISIIFFLIFSWLGSDKCQSDSNNCYYSLLLIHSLTLHLSLNDTDKLKQDSATHRERERGPIFSVLLDDKLTEKMKMDLPTTPQHTLSFQLLSSTTLLDFTLDWINLHFLFLKKCVLVAYER